jgi:starch synthase
MYIVQIASECAPVAKVGGLGDVLYGLSRELQVRGNRVEIILPKYDCMRYDQIWGLDKVYHDLWVPWHGGSIHCSVWYGEVYGLRCYFIEPHSKDNFFNRGGFYGYKDEISRFTFFSKASLEFLLKSGRRPDIIHCHDWQTGIIPVLLFEMYNHSGMWNQRVCYTIHNFKHQGVTSGDVLSATGLGRANHFMHFDRLRDNINPNAVNLMKGGIVYSNFITTVSPHHAWEACSTDQGFGLQQTLQTHRAKFDGVLNGIDYDVWNPEIDHFIPARYNMETIEDKYHNKNALRDRLLLRKEYKPIVAYVGRLDPQKGLHLIRHALFFCLQHDSQFVLLGSSPEKDINAHFWHLKNNLNDNPDCHLEIGYNEELSHMIYAGADMLIMPSLFEPCGLPQMIGLKYGTIPIVRAVGGLVNTVFDRDHRWDMPPDKRNGYVFDQSDYHAVESALHRALGLWNLYPDEFRRLMLNGMRYDFSWTHPGAKYLEIYEYIRHK